MSDPSHTDDKQTPEAALQHALEREVATRDILDAINQNQDDEMPVFDVILDHASRICRAPLAGLGLISDDRKHYRIVAHRGARPEFIAFIQENPPEMDPDRYVAARAMLEMRTIHVDDLGDPALYGASDNIRSQSVALEGVRSTFYVPLISQGQSIGGLFLYRRVVQPFTRDEIALVETFATQAVIAIENVRRFRDLQARLEREAATRRIMQVISQSRSDETPVFEVILENAARLCNAPHALLLMRNAENTLLELAASNSAESAFANFLRETPHDLANSGSLAVQALKTGDIQHVLDVREVFGGDHRAPQLDKATDIEGMRTVLIVPLMQGAEAIGVLCLYKLECATFSQDEITLVETFAEQAVIAIENVRQFKALETLNAELGDRVEAQVGEIERMGRLKRFLPSAVADTVISQGSEALLKSHRALLGVLFCDMRGFTAFCETAEPEETIEVLQTYHEEMGALIAAHGAGVDTRAGDGIMVLFNDPLPCDDPAGDALRLGLAMRARMRDLCKGWKKLGHNLGFGVGISLGYATVGMVGSEGRFEYTASGTAVNLAARLCDHASDGEVLLSPRAFAAVEEDYGADTIGEISLKGIRAPVEVFRVTVKI